MALPDSLDTHAQFTEKSLLAYRPMAHAQQLLAQRARRRLLPEGEGLFVANPVKRPMSGWVQMPVTCLREDYQSVEDPARGVAWPLQFEPGVRAWARPQNPGELSVENESATFPDQCPRQVARFWLERLEGNRLLKLFNNFWYTNFAADSHGLMEFEFELAWRAAPDGEPQEWAEALLTEPVALINSHGKLDRLQQRYLWQP